MTDGSPQNRQGEPYCAWGYRASYQVLRGGLDKEFVALADKMLDEAKGQARLDPVSAWKAAAAAERAAMG